MDAVAVASGGGRDTCTIPSVRFGEAHFGQAPLGPRRRVQRLVRAADRMAAHPGGTLPDKLREPAAYQGLRRWVKHPPVTHEAVWHTHRQRTRERLRQLPGTAGRGRGGGRAPADGPATTAADVETVLTW